MPSDLTLAVDLNGNGIRDLGEPVIRQGEEPYTDSGTDGLADSAEPGYDAVANPDPNQDDYDFQLNPGGTENDHVWEQGEPFQDVGLDGVTNTPQQSNGGYDVGEGDGKFTLSTGASAALPVRPARHPSRPLDAARRPHGRRGAPARDVWADGGVRDMANFAADARPPRRVRSRRVKNADGTQVQPTVFYNNFENLPGCDPTQPNEFLAVNVLWNDVPRAAHMRYGYVDATAQMIAEGDGQHVGTGSQAVYRLVSGFYFAANAWPDADRTVSDTLIQDPTDPDFNGETTTINSLGTTCELAGKCNTYFTGPEDGADRAGRRGRCPPATRSRPTACATCATRCSSCSTGTARTRATSRRPPPSRTTT